MKTSLWVVIVLVTGIVGFLVGYSTSSYTGIRNVAGAEAGKAKVEQVAAPSQAPAGYGAQAPAGHGSQGPASGAEKPAATQPVSTGGYR